MNAVSRGARGGRAPLGQGVVLLGVLAAAVAGRRRLQHDAQPSTAGFSTAPEARIPEPVVLAPVVPAPFVLAPVHASREEAPAAAKPHSTRGPELLHRLRYAKPRGRLAVVTGLLIASSGTSALGTLMARLDAPSPRFVASAAVLGGTPRMLVAEGREPVTVQPAVPAPIAAPAAAKPAPKVDDRTASVVRASRGAPRSVAPGLWPVSGPITGAFGERRGGHRHPGIDISAPTGTPVVAPVAGTVIFAGPPSSDYSGYGLLVIIDHGDGDISMYAHLSRVLATRGQQIAPGMVLGLVGSTGHATGPHLHFEIRRRGDVIDPAAWLITRRV